jgi:hypothetical protein
MWLCLLERLNAPPAAGGWATAFLRLLWVGAAGAAPRQRVLLCWQRAATRRPCAADVRLARWRALLCWRHPAIRRRRSAHVRPSGDGFSSAGVMQQPGGPPQPVFGSSAHGHYPAGVMQQSGGAAPPTFAPLGSGFSSAGVVQQPGGSAQPMVPMRREGLSQS